MATGLAKPGRSVPARPVPATGVRGPLVFAVLVAVFLFGGFGTWSVYATLESASIAQGSIAVDQNRKSVQHLEGGTIAELLVKDGDDVETGQVLVRLDRTAAEAQVELLRGQLLASLALEARLRAERDGNDAIVFPDTLGRQRSDPKVAELMAAEQRIFAARRSQIESQTNILRQRNLQVVEEIKGLEQEIKAQDRQLALIAQEAATVEDLVKKGFERQPRLLALQRQQADIEGQRAQNIGRIARGKQSIGEGEMRILDLGAQVLSEAVQKLRDEQTRIYDLTERLRAAQDVLNRLEIRAPVAGRVVGLKVFTVGGVVAPRDTIMEIVPRNEALIVEAQLATGDVEIVRPGLPVQLRFAALNRRSTPTLTGKVSQVSADRLTDQRTGVSYYVLRATLDDDQPGLSDLKLTPGMPVEVIVIAGERTFFDYIVKPLTDSMGRALREH